jgi:hypothetical protein
MVIVGTDRVAANGDVANKIGTYLKALAAQDNGVPFYVALPHSTIDWTVDDGMTIPSCDNGVLFSLPLDSAALRALKSHKGNAPSPPAVLVSALLLGLLVASRRVLRILS